MSSRDVVGIDLGTTNSTLAYVDTGAGEDARPQTMSVPQVVQPGVVEDRTLLPSFLYLPGPKEVPAGSLKLPWDADRDYAVGEFARNFGAPGADPAGGVGQVVAVPPRRRPQGRRSCRGRRRRAAARSRRWRRRTLLPEAPRRGVEHHDRQGRTPSTGSKQQDIILTVPASFDAVGPRADRRGRPRRRAREPHAAGGAAGRVLRLARRQRRRLAQAGQGRRRGAGLRRRRRHDRLHPDRRRRGGAATSSLTRLAVGDHILLGGDNMDLALAHHAAQAVRRQGRSSSTPARCCMLWHSCRDGQGDAVRRPEARRRPR